MLQGGGGIRGGCEVWETLLPNLVHITDIPLSEILLLETKHQEIT